MVSGFLTMVTLASTVVQPLSVSAAELVPEKEVPAFYEEVKDLLDADGDGNRSCNRGDYRSAC